MTRLPRSDRRGLVWLTAVALVLVAAVPALAQAAPAQPRIERAPRKVAWHGSATIRGRLDNGQPGGAVSLQRRLARRRFEQIATKTVNRYGRVWFQRTRLRRTADYRLVYRDPATGETAFSDVRRIRVRAGFALHLSRRDAFAGHRLVLWGHVFPRRRGRAVVVEQRMGGDWRLVARPSAGDGRYSFTWRPQHNGKRRVRVTFRGNRVNARAARTRTVRIYEHDPATWYGPGFYGHRTACGRRLTRHTLGVANRHLPCRTPVSFMYRGHTVTVPVIDRGPYGSADWDLTRAAARRLDFGGSDRVGSTR